MNKEIPTKKDSSIQDYLSLGYLYLLVLGILKDALFYGFLGINFINYSSIQDILLSPIIHLTSDVKKFLVFFVGIPVIAFGIGYLAKKYHDKNKEKEWYRSKKDFEKWEKMYQKENFNNYLITMLLLTLFGGFIGSGIGGGQKVAEKLKSQELEVNHRLTFSDGETLQVNMIGHNSEYLFYAAEKDTAVTIVPIQGNIKKIEKISGEDKKNGAG